MFTGLITAVGVVGSVRSQGAGLVLRVDTPAGFTDALKTGDSVAVDGVCQTVIAHDARGFTVEAIGTTLSRTTLGEVAAGRRLNLELALAMGERLGGHFVQGHVDGVGRVLSIERAGEHVLLTVTLAPIVAEVSVLHGSIAIDGVSLTINALPDRDSAQVAVIPYTWEHTNLSRLTPDSRVNLEGDMLGRFVVHHLKRREGAGD